MSACLPANAELAEQQRQHEQRADPEVLQVLEERRLPALDLVADELGDPGQRRRSRPRSAGPGRPWRGPAAAPTTREARPWPAGTRPTAARSRPCWPPRRRRRSRDAIGVQQAQQAEHDQRDGHAVDRLVARIAVALAVVGEQGVDPARRGGVGRAGGMVCMACLRIVGCLEQSQAGVCMMPQPIATQVLSLSTTVGHRGRCAPPGPRPCWTSGSPPACSWSRLESHYRWKGALCAEPEMRLTIKIGAGAARRAAGLPGRAAPLRRCRSSPGSRWSRQPAYAAWVRAEVGLANAPPATAGAALVDLADDGRGLEPVAAEDRQHLVGTRPARRTPAGRRWSADR